MIPRRTRRTTSRSGWNKKESLTCWASEISKPRGPHSTCKDLLSSKESPLMANKKMHADEVETDESLVRRLLAAQFPHWSKLPIDRVESFGTDNAIYKLGDDLAVRMPRVQWATAQVDKEAKWLRVLAPLLPLTLPVPV